jgi:hypothetical protein
MIQGTKQATVVGLHPTGTVSRRGSKRERRGANSHRVIGTVVGLA